MRIRIRVGGWFRLDDGCVIKVCFWWRESLIKHQSIIRSLNLGLFRVELKGQGSGPAL